MYLQGLGFSQLNSAKSKAEKQEQHTMGFGLNELRSAVEENKERDELLLHTEARCDSLFDVFGYLFIAFVDSDFARKRVVLVA